MSSVFKFSQQFGPILDVEIIFNERGSKVGVLSMIFIYIHFIVYVNFITTQDPIVRLLSAHNKPPLDFVIQTVISD